jgi:hypothetical protein
MTRRTTLSSLLLSLAAIVPLSAQTSSLQGIVTDAQGAVIPAAIVTITNTETSALRKELSDDTGAYKFLQVAPGSYKLEVQKPGFSSKTTNVALQVDVPATLNLELQVGQTTDVVNVTAEAALINTQNATVGNPFTETQVKELPLQTRNVVALLGIEPGVSSTGQVLGARPDQNNVVLDGADVNDNRGASGFNAVLPIPLDSVQEFRTTIAGQGSDLGHTAGGQVAIVTKSGSNQFHGSAYEYNRNTLFEANDWFSNRADVPRPALIRNQYGFSVGGPIKKNKLFFFYNWEERKDRSQASKLDTVPGALFREGIVQVLLKSGQTVQLTPAQVKQIDPLGIGENPTILSLMQQYPQGNDPLAASDKGLNFNDLLFNAPDDLNNHAMVGRMDYNIDDAGKHTIMVRGTLNGASTYGTGTGTTGLAQFPGQAPAQEMLDNSRGISARYTWVISAAMVNAFNFGYTRLGQSTTGTETVLPTFGFTTLAPTGRPSSRIAPTPNYTDDFTWTKGRHTIQAGINIHRAENVTSSGSNVPSYAFSRNTLLGLGADIDNSVTAFLGPLYGSSTALSSGTNVTNALGAVFGILNSYGATYNYGINGQAIPFGNYITRDYVSNSPEEYVQDTFKLKPNLTITVGLRYSIFGVPYEANGVEVIPQTSINQYFAQRVGGSTYGIPGFALPTAFLTYGVGGPVNNGPGYYPIDKNDWAPRVGVAYSPTSGSWIEKIMGKGSVLRAGAGMVYDNYGNAMAAAFANGGSPGLASSVAQPVNTNFTSGFRYGGDSFPALVPPGGGAFPYTPPLIAGGFTTLTAVSSDLKAPYEYVINVNYARPIGKGMSLEVGYAGRLAHRALVQEDYGQPMTNFTDSKSGQTWSQAGIAIAKLFNSGITPAMVKANPSLIPNQPFFQNIFPGAQNLYISGSATANFFYDVYGNYSGSFLDGLNDMDRIRQPNGGCISVFGCNTFYATQDSGLETYTNDGKSAYHALIVSLRRRVTHGWGYDFNYTWSHAIDNASGGESSTTITDNQNAFAPNQYLGPADYDARHQITANAVVEIPVGKGRRFFGNMPLWADEVVGGWQVSTLYSFRTGNPLSCNDSGVYNVNYEYSSLCILAPGAKAPIGGFTFDQAGIPSIFSNTNVANDFVAGYPGVSGARGNLRGPGFWNDDVAVSKFFRLPKEGYRLQLRGEAYNVLNHENFANPSSTSGLAISSPTTFGEITSTNTASAPRVLQLAMRFEF